VTTLYLYPGTISLISLIELRLFIKTKKIVICCPDSFYRRGNVQIICNKYDIKLVKTLNKLVKEVKDRIKYYNKNIIR
jgi:hypothetical protein